MVPSPSHCAGRERTLSRRTVIWAETMPSKHLPFAEDIGVIRKKPQVRFICVNDNVPEITTGMLRNACVAKDIEYIEIQARNFDFQPQRQLVRGDMMYRPAVINRGAAYRTISLCTGSCDLLPRSGGRVLYLHKSHATLLAFRPPNRPDCFLYFTGPEYFTRPCRISWRLSIGPEIFRKFRRHRRNQTGWV